MHAPSQRLREAAERGDAEIIKAAQTLFGMDKLRDLLYQGRTDTRRICRSPRRSTTAELRRQPSRQLTE